MFQKDLYNGILNVAVWGVLRKQLRLKAAKLSVVQVEHPVLLGTFCNCLFT
jgi:hypothetical protein